MRSPEPLRRPLLLLAAAAVACSQQGSPLGPGSNRAPVIRRVTLTPSVVPRGGSAEVEVEASDPEGGPLFYRYAAESGEVTPEGDQPWRARYRNTGAAASDRLVATVIDDRNSASSFTVSVTLQDNRAPELRLDDADSCHPTCRGGFDNCNPACSLVFTASASDPDGDALSFEWSGCVTESNGNRGTCRIQAPGRYSAAVVVRDPQGAAAVAAAAGEGTNRPPIVAGGGQIAAATARLNIQESDPDGDPVRCAWSGTCQCTGDTQSFNQNCAIPPGASSCFEVATCFDPFGALGDTRFDMVRP